MSTSSEIVGTDEIQLLVALETLENCDFSDAPTVADLAQFISRKATVASNRVVLCEKIHLILPLLDYFEPNHPLPSNQIRYFAAVTLECLSLDPNTQERLILELVVPTLLTQRREASDQQTIKCLDSCLRNLSSARKSSQFIFF